MYFHTRSHAVTIRHAEIAAALVQALLMPMLRLLRCSIEITEVSLFCLHTYCYNALTRNNAHAHIPGIRLHMSSHGIASPYVSTPPYAATPR